MHKNVAKMCHETSSERNDVLCVCFSSGRSKRVRRVKQLSMIRKDTLQHLESFVLFGDTDSVRNHSNGDLNSNVMGKYCCSGCIYVVP